MSTTNPVHESTSIYTGGTNVQAKQVHFQYNYQGFEPHEADELVARVAGSALYNTAEVEDPAKCHPGTREAILRRLFGALDRRSADPDKPFVWLHGAAGAGKSAIARTLCEQLHAERQSLASFFFFRASPERNTAAHLISTLTFQFRAIIPQLRPRIKQYIRENPLIFSQSLDSQASELLINPICQLQEEGKLPEVSQVAVVIDGLDECEGAETRRNVLNTLHTLQSKLPFPITILVASRPNREIEAIFKDSPFEGHTIEEPLNNERDVDADILKFYTDSFAKIEKFHVRSRYLARVEGVWPAPADLELLIKKTSGQFIFAKTVIRFVEPDRSDPDERLQMILGALPALHYRPFQHLDAVYKVILSIIEPDQLQRTLTIIGLFSCHYDTTFYRPSGLTIFFGLQTPPLNSNLVEWILDLKDGQCCQYLVGLEALLTLSADGNVEIFHKSFSDFLFDPSRSDQFYVAQDLLYERILRSFIKHHFYDPSFPPRKLMLTNMEFLFSKACITPELLSAIKLVDLVQSNVVVQQAPLPFTWGEDSWLRICDLFLRSLLESNIPDKDQLAAPIQTSLRIVATNRLRPYLEHPSLYPLLYIATRSDSDLPPEFDRELLLKFIPYIPLDLLSLEQAQGHHFTMADLGERGRVFYVLHRTDGPLLDAAREALPEHQSPDGYVVTLLLGLVDQCIKRGIDLSLLVDSKFLRDLLPVTEAHNALWSKFGVLLSVFKEQLDSETIIAIERYSKRCARQQARSLRVSNLWDPDDPVPILHHLTDDWDVLEDIIQAERVLLDRPKIPPSRADHQIARLSLSSFFYPIPIVLVVGLVLYRKGLLNR